MTMLKEVFDTIMVLQDLREKGVMRETLCRVAEDLVFNYNLSIDKHEYVVDRVFDYIYSGDIHKAAEDED